jgi:hypothetical protein
VNPFYRTALSPANSVILPRCTNAQREDLIPGPQ